MEQKSKLSISVKSFISVLVVIFLLMVGAYILTLILPGGSYLRVPDESGRMVIDLSAGFTPVEGGISFLKWLASPFLVLGAEGGGTLIAVIAFLLIIGGVFNALNECGLMQYLLNKVCHRFSGVRYRLMAIMMLMFMAMGSLIGSFEECVPLVPMAVALSISLGWDALTGVGMSLLAVGCGFAAGVCNPFTVGVAQQLASLPMFSGVSMRLLSFALIYLLLLWYVRRHAKKIESKTAASLENNFVPNKQLDRGVNLFAGILGCGIFLILCSGFLPALQDYTMIIVAAAFLAAGLTASFASGMKGKALLSSCVSGVVAILPAVLMILMASSIRYILEEAQILDTILHKAVGLTGTLPRFAVILFLYLIVLGMNFLIPSGSAKAFMLIPLILPLAQIFDISPQLCVLAFAFGDGFSNVVYPTNPALLIGLGLAEVSYGKWFRWSIGFQLLTLLLTSGLLLLGLVIGY